MREYEVTIMVRRRILVGDQENPHQRALDETRWLREHEQRRRPDSEVSLVGMIWLLMPGGDAQ